MNYIELINKFWIENEEHSFQPTAVALYFYLLKVNNRCSWRESFKHNNKKIEIELSISYKTLCTARNILKQAGLISFKTQNGNANTTYSLTSSIKDEVADEVRAEVADEVRARLRMSKDKLNKTKQNIKKDTKEKFDLSFVDVAFMSLIKDFIFYRSKDLRKPFKTQRGVKMFYNELLKLSGKNLQKAKKLVAHAKGKEWQTVYPITKDSKTNEDNGKGKNKQSNSESIEGKTNPLDYSERF